MTRRKKAYSFEDGLIAPGLSALARVFLFSQWGRIGVRHYLQAVDQPDPGVAFDDLLVAVAAAAFALDSYVRDLPHDRVPKKHRVPCSLSELSNAGDGHYAWQVLTHNYVVEETQAQRWHGEIHNLFALRGNAVHYTGQPEPLYLHDNGTYYHRLVGVYTPEIAREQLELVRDVLTHCLQTPRREFADLTDLIERSLGSTLTGFDDLP